MTRSFHFASFRVFRGPSPANIAVVKFTALLAFVTTCAAQENHAWTDRAGHTFSAQIVACDALRATLDVAGRGKSVVALAALSAADVAFARHWRASTRDAPLIDPACLPPWPAQAAA